MKNVQQCTLRNVPAGRIVQVAALNADKDLRSRLLALGILPGTRIEVCADCCGGGVRRIKVRGSCLLVGDGMADAVECAPEAPCCGIASSSPKDRGVCGIQ